MILDRLSGRGSDHVQLSVEEYRDKLYDMITSKKAHIRRIQHGTIGRPPASMNGGGRYPPTSGQQRRPYPPPAQKQTIRASSSENFFYQQQQKQRPFSQSGAMSTSQIFINPHNHAQPVYGPGPNSYPSVASLPAGNYVGRRPDTTGSMINSNNIQRYSY